MDTPGATSPVAPLHQINLGTLAISPLPEVRHQHGGQERSLVGGHGALGEVYLSAAAAVHDPPHGLVAPALDLVLRTEAWAARAEEAAAHPVALRVPDRDAGVCEAAARGLLVHGGEDVAIHGDDVHLRGDAAAKAAALHLDLLVAVLQAALDDVVGGPPARPTAAAMQGPELLGDKELRAVGNGLHRETVRARHRGAREDSGAAQVEAARQVAPLQTQQVRGRVLHAAADVDEAVEGARAARRRVLGLRRRSRRSAVAAAGAVAQEADEAHVRHGGSGRRGAAVAARHAKYCD
mmetsp:Transcript_71755/g.201354  ORF Transcript_71755/g.201354 Transcript_71755/m.201354 type:complete len:294 (-) Transcript_71755:12-893(-)